MYAVFYVTSKPATGHGNPCMLYSMLPANPLQDTVIHVCCILCYQQTRYRTRQSVYAVFYVTSKPATGHGNPCMDHVKTLSCYSGDHRIVYIATIEDYSCYK